MIADLFIGGEWRPRDARFDVCDPADGSVIARFAIASEQDCLDAVDAAAAAQPAWAATAPRERSELLRFVYETLTDEAEAVAREAGHGRFSLLSILAGTLTSYGAFAILAAIVGALLAAADVETDFRTNDWAGSGAVGGLATAGFSLSELCALYLSRTMLSALAGGPFHDSLTSAFDKLTDALPPALWRFIDQLPLALAAKAPTLRATTAAPRMVDALLSAILAHRRVHAPLPADGRPAPRQHAPLAAAVRCAPDHTTHSVHGPHAHPEGLHRLARPRCHPQGWHLRCPPTPCTGTECIWHTRRWSSHWSSTHAVHHARP